MCHVLRAPVLQKPIYSILRHDLRIKIFFFFVSLAPKGRVLSSTPSLYLRLPQCHSIQSIIDYPCLPWLRNILLCDQVNISLTFNSPKDLAITFPQFHKLLKLRTILYFRLCVVIDSATYSLIQFFSNLRNQYSHRSFKKGVFFSS